MPPKWGKAAGGTLTTPPAESGGASPKPKAKAWGKAKAPESPAASESASAPKAKAKAWGKKADTPAEGSESAPKAKAKAWGKKADSPAVSSGAAPKAKAWGKAKQEPVEQEAPEPTAVADAPPSRKVEEADSELASMKVKLQEAEAKAADVAELKSKLEEAAAFASENSKKYQAELVSMGDCKAQIRMEKEIESEAMKKVAAIVKKENDSHVSELKAQLQAEQWRLQAVELESGAERLRSQVLRLETAEHECKRAAEIEAQNSEQTIAELRLEMRMDRMRYQEDQARWGVNASTGAAPSMVESLAANLNARLDTGSLIMYKTDPRFWK